MINISTILNLTIGGKILLKDTQLTISDGEHYGLIGKNGIGKTTLLNYILTNPKLNHTGISDIYMVSQEIEPSDDSVLNYILNKNIKRTEMLNEYNKIMNEINNGNTDDKLMEEMEKIIEQMNDYEFQKDESKVRKILTYLGFTIKEQDNPVKLFSGGWRMRISLATALYMKPELLLLDEPTNHLDLEACIWLTEYLSEWKKTLIIVSHDVNFLNKNLCDN
jgi:ATP-binding cassette subfamily F protein 1